MPLDLKININKYLENNKLKIDINTFQKMIFIFNALDDGWSIKKMNNSFILKNINNFYRYSIKKM